MDNEKMRIIPIKNYIILGIIIIVTFLLIYYLYMWYDAYKETKLNMRIMDSYMEVINYNELDDYLVEIPNAIIYVSVLENEKIREFEKKFKKEFKKGNVDRNILYLDITDDIKNAKVKDTIYNKYNINGLSIIDVPSIMIIEDGSLQAIYNIKDNNYNIDDTINFINNVVFHDESDEVNG